MTHNSDLLIWGCWKCVH